MKDAIKTRHMVRRYINKPIPKELVSLLNERIGMNNASHNLNLQLVTENDDGLGAMAKLLAAKTVNNYIILAGPDSENLDEKLGYCGADLILYAQTLGLNTWWVGGTFNRRVSKFVDNKKVIGIIAIGYGQTQGMPHKSKIVEDVSKYNGDSPEWFLNGIKASLLAPTALNKQDYKIIGNGNKVKIDINNGIFTGANKGLIKYHFELGAGKENFEWE